MAVVGIRTAARHQRDVLAGIDAIDFVLVGDVKVTGWIGGHAIGHKETRAGSRLGSRGDCGGSAAGIDGDVAGRVDHADHAVAKVGDKDIAGQIGGELIRRSEQNAGGRARNRDAAVIRRSGKKSDIAGGIHLAHDVVAGVGDIDVAQCIHGYALRTAQLGAGGRPAVAAVTADALLSGKGRDIAGAIDHANDVIEPVGDVQVAGAVKSHLHGRVQPGAGGCMSIPGVAADAGRSSEGADFAGCLGDLPNRVVGGVTEVDVAQCIGGNASARLDEAGVGVVAAGRRTRIAVAAGNEGEQRGGELQLAGLADAAEQDGLRRVGGVIGHAECGLECACALRPELHGDGAVVVGRHRCTKVDIRLSATAVRIDADRRTRSSVDDREGCAAGEGERRVSYVGERDRGVSIP